MEPDEMQMKVDERDIEAVEVSSSWRPDAFERRLMALDRAIQFHHAGSDVEQVIETASKFEGYLNSDA